MAECPFFLELRGRKSLVSAAIVGARRGTIAIMRKLRESNAAPFSFPFFLPSFPPPLLTGTFSLEHPPAAGRRRLALSLLSSRTDEQHPLRARARAQWELQETNRRV